MSKPKKQSDDTWAYKGYIIVKGVNPDGTFSLKTERDDIGPDMVEYTHLNRHYTRLYHVCYLIDTFR